jgi:energy-coupling factor transport system ATP-binding protein
VTLAVSCQNIHFSYPSVLTEGLPVPVFAGLDLSVQEGECLGVIGPNGAGKSTLLLILAGLAPHFTDGKLSGNVSVTGRVGMVFQEIEGQLFNPTVETEIAWGLENLGLPLHEITERVAWALDAVDITDLRERSPGALSGGQQKRVALAAALAMHPDILLLDEPSGGLDPEGRAEILTALTQLKQRYPVTVIMAENDADVVAQFADRIIVLHEGKLAREGTPREIFREIAWLDQIGAPITPAARLASLLRDHLPNLDFVTTSEAHEQLSHSVRQPSPLPPLLQGEGEKGRRLGGERNHRPYIIALDYISYTYPDGPMALRDVSVKIPAGQFVAVVGANGSGKTTLVKHLIGLLRPATGKITVNGFDTSTMSVGELAQHVGFAFQQPEQQLFSPTVRDEIAFGPRNLGLQGPALADRVAATLDQFGLTQYVDHPPAVLSFSLRRLVALASIAALQAPILALDEPLVGLDGLWRRRVIAWLMGHHEAGGTVIMVTHHMRLAAKVDRVMMMREGQIMLDAPPAEIFRHVDELRAAGLREPMTVTLSRELGCETPILRVRDLANHLLQR